MEKERDISREIKELIVKEFFVDEKEVVPEAKLTDNLGLDSVDLLELRWLLEDENQFGIEIPDEDLDEITTFGKVVEYIQKRLAEKEQKPLTYSI